MNTLEEIIAGEKEKLRKFGYSEEHYKFLNDVVSVKGKNNSILVLKNDNIYLR